MKLSLDSHKLLFHLNVVNNWLGGKKIYPICCSVSLTQLCNYRCIFCVYDSFKRKEIYLDSERILSIIKELHNNGLNSLFFSGEGDYSNGRRNGSCKTKLGVVATWYFQKY